MRSLLRIPCRKRCKWPVAFVANGLLLSLQMTGWADAGVSDGLLHGDILGD